MLTADPEARRLRLSLVPGAAASAGDGAGGPGADPMGGLQPGDVVEGVVRSVTTAQEVWLHVQWVRQCAVQRYEARCAAWQYISLWR